METEKKRKYCILFVDKCTRLRYNMHINEKEVHKMTAMYAKKYAYSGNCSTFAAAGTSMPNARILDTFAVWMLVVIFCLNIVCSPMP